MDRDFRDTTTSCGNVFRFAEAKKARVLGRSRAMEKPLGTWFRQWLIVHKINALDGLSDVKIESHLSKIQRWRKIDPSLETLILLSDQFHKSVDWILRGEGQ
jgi:hypothetical protein